MQRAYAITAKLWLYPSENGAWHFLTVPKKESEIILKKYSAFKKGWGSLPVEVKIGKTVWKTSIFPDKKSATYLLPVKATVRRAEDLFVDDLVKFKITMIV